MTLYLSTDQIVRIHDSQIRCPIRDSNALEAAVHKPQTEFFGVPKYETLASKGAALLVGIAMNHPFLDGNKRTSWMATVAFLGINRVSLQDLETLEVVDFVISVVEERKSVDEVTGWLVKHSL